MNGKGTNSRHLVYTVRDPCDRVHQAAQAGVRRYAAMNGCDLNVLCWDEAMRLLHSSGNVAHGLGIVLECSDSPEDIPDAVPQRIHAVFLNCPERRGGHGFTSLHVDNKAVAQTAFRELSKLRPPAMATVGAVFGSRRWSDARTRMFTDLAGKSGVETFAFSFYGGKNDMARLVAWVAALPRSTAVFAVNDESAEKVVAAAHAAMRHIPHDLALIGVDDDAEICESSHPTITSIRMDFENMGYLAARLVANLAAARTDGRDAGLSIGPLLVSRRESTLGRGRREPNIVEAVAFIRREACNGICANDVIERSPGSRRLFTLRFREATGHSVHDEIAQVRFQNVCTLLAQTKTPLDVVAGMCGFSSDRTLRKFFRQHTGMSMSEWRRKHGR